MGTSIDTDVRWLLDYYLDPIIKILNGPPIMDRASEIHIRANLKRDGGPLSDQLADHIRHMILRGDLRSGDRLPSSRILAQEQKIARGTVITALEILIAEGLVATRTGIGMFVAPDVALLEKEAPSQQKATKIKLNSIHSPDIDKAHNVQIDFRPCRPSLEAFPVQAWRRCVSLAASAPVSPDYGDPKGDIQLRTEICAYLRRARGLAAHPEEMIITNGSVHAMHLLATVYLSSRSKVFFENPGYPLARQTFALSGAQLKYCNVDDAGLMTEGLPQRAPASSLVYVTPSHQFPTGGRLSLGRRHALIDWARQQDALIVEDDYDGEYRYDVAPLSPLAALARDCVIYCGTFSKTLFPGLRIGFAIAPRSIVDAMAAYRAITEYSSNDITQRALCHFIENGQFERHIHRMRRIYRKKGKFIADFLEDRALPAHLSGLDSGLNGLMHIDDKRSIQKMSERARRKGVLIPPLDRYRAEDVDSCESVVIGYAAPQIAEIEKGLKLFFD